MLEKKDKNLKRTISMNTVLKENKEFDEVGFAVSWKRACSNVFTQVSWLHGFQNINIIAAERLLFKFKDLFKETDESAEKIFLEMNSTPNSSLEVIYNELLIYTRKLFKTPTLNVVEFEKDKSYEEIHDIRVSDLDDQTKTELKEKESREFTDVNKEIINLEADHDILDIEVLKLRQKINKFYAINLNNGDLIQAKKELENRMSGYRIYDLKLISLHIGIITCSILISMMILLIPCKI